jgi:hypothetical protein
MMQARKNVNWIGLVSGILLIAVILLSLYNPWWQLRIGDFVYANFSPLDTNFRFLGITFLIPLLTALNISCLLLLSISAALMITYSVNPTKEYSKQLLCWSYKKPLAILTTFIVSIVGLSQIVSFIANQYAHIDFKLPIIGTSVIQVPSELLGGLNGVQIGLTVSGAFQWTFYLAIAAAALCIVTRIRYDKSVLMAKPQTLTNPGNNLGTLDSGDLSIPAST